MRHAYYFVHTYHQKQSCYWYWSLPNSSPEELCAEIENELQNKAHKRFKPQTATDHLVSKAAIARSNLLHIALLDNHYHLTHMQLELEGVRRSPSLTGVWRHCGRGFSPFVLPRATAKEGRSSQSTCQSLPASSCHRQDWNGKPPLKFYTKLQWYSGTSKGWTHPEDTLCRPNAIGHPWNQDILFIRTLYVIPMQ